MLKLQHGIDQTALFGAQTARKSAGLLQALPERLEKISINDKTIDEGACPVLTRYPRGGLAGNIFVDNG
jgi:hypothetical protein